MLIVLKNCLSDLIWKTNKILIEKMNLKRYYYYSM